MHPILFDIGGFAIHGYGFLGAMGFLAGAFLILREARSIAVDPEKVADAIFWTAIAAIAASRMLFLYQNPDAFIGWHSLIDIRSGGLVFYGALIGGLPVAAWSFRKHQLPAWAMADVFSLAFPVGHAFARVGCFLAGCCHGSTTNSGWGVTYTDPLSAAPLGISVHPTQLYEAVGLVMIAVLLQVSRRRQQFAGQIMLTYLVSYALLRMATEQFRGDERGWFLEGLLGQTLSTSQGISLLTVTLGSLALVVLLKRVGRHR